MSRGDKTLGEVSAMAWLLLKGPLCGHHMGRNHSIVETGDFGILACPNVLRNYGGVMRKLFLVLLAIACTIVAASASATEVETIALFDFAASERPESIQVDRHGHIYVSLAPRGEIRKIAPDGTQSTLAVLPLHQDVQPCQNSVGSAGITPASPWTTSAMSTST